MSTNPAEFDRTKLFGVLHDRTTGTAIQRTVRVLKIGIGVPSGPDIHVWIGQDNQWHVAIGRYEGRKRVKPDVKNFASKAEASTFYATARKNAPDRIFPAKLPHFTFLRMDAGGYVHDFDAIELHGPLPTEIDIVFLSNDPFDYRFANYTKTEMKCEGNGRDARRRVNFAQDDYQEELAAEARSRGEKFFALPNACYTMGCPFGGKECKPHSRLYFQLQNDLRFGGSCNFDTTGFRSTGQLFSNLVEIRKATGRGDPSRGRVAGIPLKLVLRPYQTTFKDAQGEPRPSTQYAASIEYRAGTAVELVESMLTHADEFQQALQLKPAPEGATEYAGEPGEVVQIDEPTADESATDAALLAEASEAAEAGAIVAEFYPENGDGRDDDLDQFSQAEPAPEKPKPSMPRRKSAAKAEPQPASPPAEAAEPGSYQNPVAEVCVKCGATELDSALTPTPEGSVCNECKPQPVVDEKVERQRLRKKIRESYSAEQILKHSDKDLGVMSLDELVTLRDALVEDGGSE